jgi:amino acid transporter
VAAIGTPAGGGTAADSASAQPRLASGALSLFDTISSTLANLAPVEGIFLSITLVVAAMGSQAPWAFLIAGIAILATGNTMSEFSRSIPSAGSFVTFIGRGFGPRLPRTGSVLSGVTYYLLMISYPITIAAVVVFLGSWVSSLFGWGNAGWLAVTLASLALTLPLLLRGVVISARTSFVMFCSEALGLLILSIVVLAATGGHGSAPLHASGGTPGGFSGLVGFTFALAVSGFVGWENSGALAEESRNPRRYIPITVFTGIIVITLLYVLSSWAAVSGFAAWKGPAAGVNFLGSPADAIPFLDLSRHYSPWFDWFIGLVGFTSSFGCFVAAANSQTRITFNGARAGLLPRRVATVTRRQVPWASVAIYVGLTVALVVIPYFALNGNAVSIFSDEASVGTVPILIVYLVANIALPLYVLATDRARFNVLRHVLIPLVGTAVLAYGVYEFVQPSQPPPANLFWAWILAIVVLAAAGTAIAYLRRPAALKQAGSLGPEFVPAEHQPPHVEAEEG